MTSRPRWGNCRPTSARVIVLRHVLGFNPREIGRVLGLPTGTVNSRMRRGLDALAERLGEGER